MGRAYLDHATGVRLDPTALAPAAGKFDNVQFVTVDHRHHQVAVVRDRFTGTDVAPHAMAFRTQRKFRIDLEQNACASVQATIPSGFREIATSKPGLKAACALDDAEEVQTQGTKRLRQMVFGSIGTTPSQLRLPYGSIADGGRE
jgi:hypothetical protein